MLALRRAVIAAVIVVAGTAHADEIVVARGQVEAQLVVELNLVNRLVGVAACLAKVFQLLLLVGVQRRRDLHMHADELVAMTTTPQLRHAPALQAEGRA